MNFEQIEIDIKQIQEKVNSGISNGTWEVDTFQVQDDYLQDNYSAKASNGDFKIEMYCTLCLGDRSVEDVTIDITKSNENIYNLSYDTSNGEENLRSDLYEIASLVAQCVECWQRTNIENNIPSGTIRSLPD
jgi:IS30 family transposase